MVINNLTIQLQSQGRNKVIKGNESKTDKTEQNFLNYLIAINWDLTEKLYLSSHPGLKKALGETCREGPGSLYFKQMHRMTSQSAKLEKP